MKAKALLAVVAILCAIGVSGMELVDAKYGYKISIPDNLYTSVTDKTANSGHQRGWITLVGGRGTITVYFYDQQSIDVLAKAVPGAPVSTMELPDRFFLPNLNIGRHLGEEHCGPFTANLYAQGKVYKQMLDNGMLLLVAGNGNARPYFSDYDEFVDGCVVKPAAETAVTAAEKQSYTCAETAVESTTASGASMAEAPGGNSGMLDNQSSAASDAEAPEIPDDNQSFWEKFSTEFSAWLVRFLLLIPLAVVMQVAVVYLLKVRSKVPFLVTLGIFVVVSLLLMWWVEAFTWGVAVFAAVIGIGMGISYAGTGHADLPDID